MYFQLLSVYLQRLAVVLTSLLSIPLPVSTVHCWTVTITGCWLTFSCCSFAVNCSVLSVTRSSLSMTSTHLHSERGILAGEWTPRGQYAAIVSTIGKRSALSHKNATPPPTPQQQHPPARTDLDQLSSSRKRHGTGHTLRMLSVKCCCLAFASPSTALGRRWAAGDWLPTALSAGA